MNAFVIYKKSRYQNDEHRESLAVVCRVLSERTISFKMALRSSVTKMIAGYDLVVTVGGDGTLLDAARYVKTTPVISVNSAPSTSVGFFSACSKAQFADFIDRFINHKIKPYPLMRLHLKLNGTQTDHRVLNDILICHKHPAISSKYEIGVGKKKEIQRSSGLWISTPAGSTGATIAAGGSVVDIKKEKLQFVTREPFSLKTYQFKKGILPLTTHFHVTSLMENGVVYIDGSRHHLAFNTNDTIEFEKSRYPLLLIGFDPQKQKKYLNLIN